MLINTSLPWAPNTWKVWVDHIMKQKQLYGLKKACMVHFNGATASATSGFIIPSQEVQKLKQYFHEDCTKETLSLLGKTYIIKSKDTNQLVAFNGHKYYIICKSKTMYIIVLCESRSKSDDAAYWIKKLNKRLIERDF